MSEHRTHVHWQRTSSSGTSDFNYDTFDRTHRLSFSGGQSVLGSSAPEYKGLAQHTNPEELLVGALSTCHMLTFLAICAKQRLTVDEYRDDAIGTLDKGASGKMQITQVRLHPQARVSGPTWPTEPEAQRARLAELHAKAHANCFIANSVAMPVAVEPRD